jgi:hypothetical protein
MIARPGGYLGKLNPSLQFAGDGAAEGDGEGVGGVGEDRAADAKQAGDHPGDLLLGGAAVSGGGRLDLLGAVFVDRDAVDAASDDRRAAGLSEFQGGRWIFREEDLFDRSESSRWILRRRSGKGAPASRRMIPHATGETAYPRTSTIPYPVRRDPGSIPSIRREGSVIDRGLQRTPATSAKQPQEGGAAK